MNKKQADLIKSTLKREGVYFKPYFKSKTGELRLEIYDCNISGDHTPDYDKLKSRILAVTEALVRNGLRPKYRRETRVYQGFIEYHYMIFE